MREGQRCRSRKCGPPRDSRKLVEVERVPERVVETIATEGRGVPLEERVVLLVKHPLRVEAVRLNDSRAAQEQKSVTALDLQPCAITYMLVKARKSPFRSSWMTSANAKSTV